MPAPDSLAITFDELAGEIGSYLGYLRGAKYQDPVWTKQQEDDIKSCVKAGIHNVYFPVPLPGESKSHSWSFLKPTATLTLASGDRTVLLPDDFAGFEDGVWNVTSASYPLKIDLGTPDLVDGEYARASDSTGRPRWASERPQRGPRNDAGQRRELYLFPQADAAYTLRVSYYLIPDLLDGTHQHCYGGKVHAQTFLESCLAVAEQRFNDRQTTHTVLFAQRLAASISADRRHKPQQLGQMNDGTLERYPLGQYDTVVRVNGVTY